MIINPNKFFKISVSSFIHSLLYCGIILIYWGSLLPWFMWSVERFYAPLAAILIGSAAFVASFTKNDIFSRKDFLIPSLCAFTLLIFLRIVNNNSFFGFVEALIHVYIFYNIFRLDIRFLRKVADVLCITMGSFMLVSVTAFILYVGGFPFPYSDILNENLQYSFQNFYFFIIDDRQFLLLFPRFQSVFLEPGHLGTATSFLLFTQIGKWRKWYNIPLLIATFLSFSLAAYVLITLIMFASAWIRRKQLFRKIVYLVILFAGVFICATFYNEGDNLVNNLIVERLKIDDGKLVGDNRVTDSFEAVYDDYLKSSDIWFGREYSLEEFGFGNAGYRVFIYDNGIISLALVILLYITMSMSGKDPRARIAMLLIAAAGFWVRAIPLTYYFFIPLYLVPYVTRHDIVEKDDINLCKQNPAETKES